MGLKLVKNSMSFSIDKINKQLGALAKDAHKVWVDNTPKRSGNAKNKTKLEGSKINANYPYAERLDQGYSKQKPRGMSEPTGKFIERELKKRIRK